MDGDEVPCYENLWFSRTGGSDSSVHGWRRVASDKPRQKNTLGARKPPCVASDRKARADRDDFYGTHFCFLTPMVVVVRPQVQCERYVKLKLSNNCVWGGPGAPSGHKCCAIFMFLLIRTALGDGLLQP